jgi:membrane-associated phospholipid phosphatase
LLWLAARLAKNRERLGVHYASDSSAGRHLAAGLWRALLHDANAGTRIECATLRKVLMQATAEWPTPWP